ncbi:ArnT family glycosyltransferase [Caloramator mitchellensis]|uniref:ArnT family glycosyltransferase n=1 Tax=Caloramator mitchellensis TaxID=908809 RepID=UPI00071755AF|nr:glycosyltransferase family 39 protein [Caloramator mitchellensis]
MKKRFILIFLFVAVLIFISALYGNKFYLGSFASMNNDDVKYIRSGIYILKKGSLIYKSKNFNTVYIMPGLPFVLAAFFRFFSVLDGVFAFRIFQDILQGISAYLIYLLAKEVFDEKVAIVALIIDILYLPEYFVPQVVLNECIFKFLFLLSIYFAIKGTKTYSFKNYILSGLAWSLSLYFKPVVALFPIIIALVWIKKKIDFAFALRVSSAIAVIFIAIMMPWWIRNYNLYDRFIPFTLSSGNPMLQATYYNYDNSIDFIEYETGDDEIENDKYELYLTRVRFYSQSKKFGWRYVYWYLIKKTTYLFTRPFYWRDVFGVGLKYVAFVHNFIMLTGILGILFSRKNILSDFLLYILIYFVLIYIPYFTFSRYGYPLMPILIIFSAFLLQKIFFFDISRNFK